MGDCFGSCIQSAYKSDVVRSGDNGLTWVRLNMGGIHVVSESPDKRLWGASVNQVYRGRARA